MPADGEGWHRLPASAVPTLRAAAQKRVWTGIDTEAPPTAPAEPCEFLAAPAAIREAERSNGAWIGWSRPQLNCLRALALVGATAKQIAADPLINRSPEAVQRKLNRLGIKLREMPRGTVCFNLPLSASIVFDKAAAVAKLTRNELMRRQALRAAEGPARYGLTVVAV